MKPTLSLFVLVLATACAGEPSDQPPIHLNPDMDWQPRFEAYEANPLFADGQAMRIPPEGTVPQGMLRDDDAYHRGKAGPNAWISKAPIEINGLVLERGRERYNIYCSPCHDQTGSSKGTVMRRGHPPAIEIYSDATIARPDGELFDIISNGRGNMPPYRHQIPVEDRWKIVAWVRVLQRAARSTAADVPPDRVDAIAPATGGQ